MDAVRILLLATAAVLAAEATYGYVVDVPQAVGWEVGFTWLFANLTAAAALGIAGIAWIWGRGPRADLSATVLTVLVGAFAALAAAAQVSGGAPYLWFSLAVAAGCGLAGALMLRAMRERDVVPAAAGPDARRK